jgi:hypothetical protein
VAHVVQTVSKYAQAASNSATFSLLTHNQNDVYLIFTVCQNGDVSSTPSGWTYHTGSTYGDPIKCYSYVAGATPKTSLTVATTNSNTRVVVHMAVLRGVPTSSYVDVYAERPFAGTTSLLAPSVTTTTSESIVFYAAANCGGSCAYFDNGTIHGGAANAFAYFLGSTFAYNYKIGAGATGTQEAFFIGDAGTVYYTSVLTVAIKCGDGQTGPHPAWGSAADKPAKIIHVVGDGLESGPMCTTTSDPTGVISTIQSKTTHNKGSTGYTLLAVNDASIFLDWISATAMFTVGGSTSGDFWIGQADMTTMPDLTDKIVVFQGKPNGFIYEADSPQSVLGFGDGTNYLLYSYGGANAVPNIQKGEFPVLIQLQSSSSSGTRLGYELQEYGTAFNPASITKIIFAHRSLNTYAYNYVSPINVLQTMKILGGYSTAPATMDSAVIISKTMYLNTVQAQGGQAVGQFICFHKIKFGDGGTTDTYVDISGQSIEFPVAANKTASPPTYQAQIASGRLGLEIDVGTGVNFYFGNQTINCGDYHTFTLTSGNPVGTGLLLQNANPSISSSLDSALGDCIFQGCKEMTGGGDFSGGCTFDGCVDTNSIRINASTQAGLQAKLDLLANCTFRNNNVAIRIEFTGTGAVALSANAITFSGNTTDIHYNSTNSSALTITNDGGSNITTSAYSGSATGVTIVSPSVTFTITGLVSGSEVRAYTGTVSSPTLVASTESSGTSFSFTNSYGGTNGYIVIRKANYVFEKIVLTPYPSTTTSIPINQRLDPWYRNP